MVRQIRELKLIPVREVPQQELIPGLLPEQQLRPELFHKVTVRPTVTPGQSPHPVTTGLTARIQHMIGVLIKIVLQERIGHLHHQQGQEAVVKAEVIAEADLHHQAVTAGRAVLLVVTAGQAEIVPQVVQDRHHLHLPHHQAEEGKNCEPVIKY